MGRKESNQTNKNKTIAELKPPQNIKLLVSPYSLEGWFDPHMGANQEDSFFCDESKIISQIGPG